MLKMLIVEDEKWEREGLVDFLDWSALGIELSAVACDGFEGIDKARRIRPDIIITDIKMPGMDGLKMSRRIREFLPEVRIIILTGYDDFKLAREAINISADAYILKPVEEAEMLDVLGKAAAECNESIKKKDEEEKLKALLDESMTNTRREMLNAVLRERPQEETLQQVVTLGVLPVCGCFSVIAAGRDPHDVSDPHDCEFSIDMERADAALKSEILSNGLDFTTSLNNADGEVLIIAGWNGIADRSLGDAAQAVADYISNKGTAASVGVGMTVRDMSELYQSCRQAREALGYSLFWGDRGISFFSELESLQQDNAAKVPEFLARGNHFTKQLMHSLRAADKSRTSALLEEMFRFISAARWADRSMIINFLYGLLNETPLLFYNTNLPEPEEGVAGAVLLSLPDIRSIREYVSVFFEKLLCTISDMRSNKDEYVIKKVEQIITEKYMTDINIRTIAADIYLSPNYLGSVFKKCTGKSLSDYICLHRLEKARELLLSPGNKVSRVAREVGIPNVSYFCTLFKDKFGIAPGEYQEMVMRCGL